MDFSFGWNRSDEEKLFNNYYFNKKSDDDDAVRAKDELKTTTRTRRVTITEIIDENEDWNLVDLDQVRGSLLMTSRIFLRFLNPLYFSGLSIL